MKFEQHLLLKLIEECAEVQQRASKQMQFGAGEIEPGQEMDNGHRLLSEILDLYAILHFVVDNCLVPPILPEFLPDRVREKCEKIAKYQALSESLGMLQEIDHLENCAVYDQEPSGIRKPCDCQAWLRKNHSAFVKYGI